MPRVSSFANYEDIFDRSVDPAFLCELEGNVIVDASFSAERILGNEEQGCLNGRSLDEFIEPEVARYYKKQIEILKRKFYPRSFETKVGGEQKVFWDAEICGNLIYLKDERALLQVVIKNITEKKEHERLQAVSAEHAQMVVEHMLPKKIPQPTGYEIAVYYEACSVIGGDFYDFIHVDDQHLGLCLGDARGHGLEAALVMGMVRKALVMCAIDELCPSDVLSKTNDHIAPDLKQGNFATCFYGVLNHQKHEMEFCCAGHNQSIVVSSKSQTIDFIETKGIPLGFKLKEGAFRSKLTTANVCLQSGDAFVQYSDGIIETENKRGEMYDLDRFEQSCLDAGSLSASEICKKVIDDVKCFQKKHPQRDDISLMVIKRMT